MATVLKTRKPKSRSQARIYEHTENLEPVATKEFVRQELAPVRESVNRLWQVMLGGFALLLTVMLYLHSDTKQELDMLTQEMNRRFTEVNKKLDMLMQKQ